MDKPGPAHKAFYSPSVGPHGVSPLLLKRLLGYFLGVSGVEDEEHLGMQRSREGGAGVPRTWHRRPEMGLD